MNAWAAVLEGLPHAAWLVDLASQRVVAANAAAATLLGRPAASLVGERAEQLAASPEDLAYWAAAAPAVTAAPDEADEAAAPDAGTLWSDTLIATADGRMLHVSRSIRTIPAGMGAASHALVLLRDRSAEQRIEAERETLLAELQATLESTADGILVLDLSGRIRSFNRRFAEIWGMPLALLLQHDDTAVQAWMSRGVASPEDYEQRLHALQQTTLLTTTDRLTLHTGQLLERVSRPLWSGGQTQGRVYSYRDLSARIAADRRIEALSLSDALTGLPNRRRLAERVTETAAMLRREGGSCALLVVDLDRFRQINDSLGHDTGDRVLIDVAKRIQGCLRQDDMLARTGGDQFALLICPADAQAAEATARRVLNVVAQPSSIDGVQFTLTCSIGMALCPSHGKTVDDLARHVDA